MRASLFCLALILFALGPAPTATSQPTSDGPVVLELFTSQGCSSCPPADRLLTELAAADPKGEKVVPLSFHVDYWNYIGWTDPFSHERWSERQRDYGRAFRDDRIYTPQLVVDGRVHCVGSKRDCVRREIEAAQARVRSARVALKVESDGTGKWVATAQVEGLKTVKGKSLALMVALYETQLTTPVRRGENARRTLDNDFVVRRLERAGTVSLEQGKRREGTVTFTLDPSWNRDNLGLAAFLQHPSSREIFAAARWSG